jgi:hypothetical protein
MRCPIITDVSMLSVDIIVNALTVDWRNNAEAFEHLRPGQYLYNRYNWEFKNSYESRDESEVIELFIEWAELQCN